MTKINVVDKRTACCNEPEKKMAVVLENDRIKLETSNGYVMLSIQLDGKTIFFRDLYNIPNADQYAQADGSELWQIKDRC